MNLFDNQNLIFSFKVENDKYEKGVTWAKDVLFNLKFSVDRIKTVANKIIKDVPKYV